MQLLGELCCAVGLFLICYIQFMKGFVSLIECSVCPGEFWPLGRIWQALAGSRVERLPAALWPSPALCTQLTAQEVLLTRAMAQAGSHDRCLGKGASSRDKRGVGKTKAIAVNPLCRGKCEFALISLIWQRMWQQDTYKKTLGIHLEINFHSFF